MSRKNSSLSPRKAKGSAAPVFDNSQPIGDTLVMVNEKPVASETFEVILPSTTDLTNSKKKEIKMSKTQDAALTNQTPAIELKKTVKFFDLTTFKEDKKEIKISFTPATTYEDGIKRLGNDEKALVAAINSILQARAVSDEKKKVLGDKGVGKKVVLEFVKPFRMTPPYSQMVTLEKGQDGWKAQYNLQTAELVKQVASNEFMLNAIRAAAAASTDEDEDGDETE